MRAPSSGSEEQCVTNDEKSLQWVGSDINSIQGSLISKNNSAENMILSKIIINILDYILFIILNISIILVLS